ncbi:zinc ribbon domain-containing protein [Streptomyces acidicola]|uniref:zinc ribbon domain-containing protein n=1 Tax=Streptomyces acidicola TaxID=2596892 RepID=UPI0038223840
MAGVKSNALQRGMRKPVAAEAAESEVFRVGKYLFSGTLRCGRINLADELCCSRMVGNAASGKNAKYGDYYRCNDPNCKGVGRRVAAVDKYLEELVLSYLDKNFKGTKPKTTPYRGASKLAALRVQRKKIKDSVVEGEVDWGDVHDLLARLNRKIKMLEEEESDHIEKEAKGNLLRGWGRKKWVGMDLEEKKEIISQVLVSVVVLPVPEGVSDKAPFDSNLLKVNWRKEKESKPQGQYQGPRPATDVA